MREIRASELQKHLVELLDDVERGQTVLIMRNGQPVARLVPETRSGQGRQSAADAAVDDLKAWRQTLPPTGMTIDDILSARDEGRR